MSQHLVSRRTAVLGFPALAATPAAALSLPSDNSEFWSAVARYKAVCAHMRATKGATDEELDANLEEHKAVSLALLRTPASGIREAIALLAIAHDRLCSFGYELSNGLLAGIEFVDVADDIDLEQADRAFLEKAIRMLDTEVR